MAPPWLRRWGPLRKTRGSVMDRAALHYYTVAASVGAVATGILSMSMYVLAKSLNATPQQLAIMSSIGSTCQLLGIFGGEFIRGRDRRPAIALFGSLSRGVLLLNALVVTAWQFIAVAAAFGCTNALLSPALTILWRDNIGPQRRNQLWGVTATIVTVVSVVAGVATGWLLDLSLDAYRWVFPMAGVVGLLGVFFMVRMPHRGRHKRRAVKPHTLHSVVIAPIKRFVGVLRNDGYFRHFEASFFLYGIAFMLMAPVLPLYLTKLAQMNYLQSSIAESGILPLGAVGLSIAWGRLMDRTSPSMTCAIVFAILALFPLILLTGLHLHELGVPLLWIVYLGYLVYGIGLSGMNVAWNLAPLMFAGKSDAGAYTGTHITLTGVRGAVAPIVGGWVMKHYGFPPVFIASACFFLAGSIGMQWLERRLSRRPRSAEVSGS